MPEIGNHIASVLERVGTVSEVDRVREVAGTVDLLDVERHRMTCFDGVRFGRDRHVLDRVPHLGESLREAEHRVVGERVAQRRVDVDVAELNEDVTNARAHRLRVGVVVRLLFGLVVRAFGVRQVELAERERREDGGDGQRRDVTERSQAREVDSDVAAVKHIQCVDRLHFYSLIEQVRRVHRDVVFAGLRQRQRQLIAGVRRVHRRVHRVGDVPRERHRVAAVVHADARLLARVDVIVLEAPDANATLQRHRKRQLQAATVVIRAGTGGEHNVLHAPERDVYERITSIGVTVAAGTIRLVLEHARTVGADDAVVGFGVVERGEGVVGGDGRQSQQEE